MHAPGHKHSSESTLLGLPTKSVLVFCLSIVAVAVVVGAGLLPGELMSADGLQTPLYLASIFIALFVSTLAFNSFLTSGFLRALWFGNAFFLFAVVMTLFVVTPELNPNHTLLILGILLTPVVLFHAYQSRGVVTQQDRVEHFARSIAVGVIAGLLLYIYGAVGAPFAEFVVGMGHQHTIEFRAIAAIAAILFALGAIQMFRVHLKTRSTIFLSLAAGAVWFAGAAVGFAVSDVVADEWHFLSPLMELVGFLIVFAGFISVYGKLTVELWQERQGRPQR